MKVQIRKIACISQVQYLISQVHWAIRKFKRGLRKSCLFASSNPFLARLAFFARSWLVCARFNALFARSNAVCASSLGFFASSNPFSRKFGLFASLTLFPQDPSCYSQVQSLYSLSYPFTYEKTTSRVRLVVFSLYYSAFWRCS